MRIIIYAFEVIVMLAFAGITITQVVVPLVVGTQMFPSLRRRGVRSAQKAVNEEAERWSEEIELLKSIDKLSNSKKKEQK